MPDRSDLLLTLHEAKAPLDAMVRDLGGEPAKTALELAKAMKARADRYALGTALIRGERTCL